MPAGYASWLPQPTDLQIFLTSWKPPAGTAGIIILVALCVPPLVALVVSWKLFALLALAAWLYSKWTYGHLSWKRRLLRAQRRYWLGDRGTSGPRVLVVGAGFSGMSAAISLRERGFPVTVIDSETGFGGTWRSCVA